MQPIKSRSTWGYGEGCIEASYATWRKDMSRVLHVPHIGFMIRIGALKYYAGLVGQSNDVLREDG